MIRKPVSFLLAIVLFGTIAAHPHFSKSVIAQLNGKEAKVSFTTYPYSEEHLKEVSEGFVFHCGRAVLDLQGDFSSGGTAIPAGSYQVRARARSVDDWTLFLIPAGGDVSSADPSNALELETATLTGLPTEHHLDVDLYSGHGSTEGKLILAVAFGERKVEGTLAFQ